MGQKQGRFASRNSIFLPETISSSTQCQIQNFFFTYVTGLDAGLANVDGKTFSHFVVRGLRLDGRKTKFRGLIVIGARELQRQKVKKKSRKEKKRVFLFEHRWRVSQLVE